MNKKVVLCVLALNVVCTSYIRAQQYDSENDFQVSLVDGGKSVEITKYVGAKQTINIPPRIEGMTVTKIGDKSFMEKEIIKVTIPNSVTSIGYAAFAYSKSLTSVTIPANVTFIGDYAFSGTSLTSITIPANVTFIGDSTFSDCTSLTSITVDGKNPNYVSESGILYNKEKTKLIVASPAGINGNITIPTSVRSINYGAFASCKRLTSITIPLSVTSIGYLAFNDCTSLTSITVSANNPSYASEGRILYNKNKTEIIAYPSASGSITIPANVTSIGDGAFSDCTSLTSITIPTRVTAIGSSAFAYCTSLTSITIPVGVTAIGKGAFSGWTDAQTINIRGKDQASADRAWGRYEGDRYSGRWVVGEWRENCIAKINYLEKHISGDFEIVPLEDGKSTEIIKYAGTKQTVNIPLSIEGRTVTRIGESAFKDMDIINVTIPANVTSIGDDAFSFCESLTSVTIPASVTSIGIDAFAYCTSLASITIPSGVTSIGNSAFYGCKSLTSITIPASVTSIGRYVFFSCTSLTSITVSANNPSYANEGRILYNKNKTKIIAYPSASGSITIPANVTSIDDGAFAYCESLTSITIPASVTSIGTGAFVSCKSLTSITIPASVTSIGDGAFFIWTSSQTINIEGKANRAATISAGWNNEWDKDCKARIVYKG